MLIKNLTSKVISDFFTIKKDHDDYVYASTDE